MRRDSLVTLTETGTTHLTAAARRTQMTGHPIFRMRGRVFGLLSFGATARKHRGSSARIRRRHLVARSVCRPFCLTNWLKVRTIS
jgi:hypothetical protein